MQPSIIKAHALTKTVSTHTESITILNKINLNIKKGETLAIIGPSGSGKSTLMSLLAGLDEFSSGDIELMGHKLSSLNEEQRAKLRRDHIGFVFQQFLLIPTLSALHNVTLPCLLKGQKEDINKATALLTQVGLAHRLHHLPTQLSGGEQQRVALARAFISEPEILFADEPTGNLDPHTAKQIADKLFAMNTEHNTTLVLVTHDLTLAQRCARRLYIKSGLLEER